MVARTRSRLVMAAHDTTATRVAAGPAAVRGSGPTRRMFMPKLSRRAFVTGSVVAAVAARAPFVHAQKRGGTLRFVPHADLKVLDPIWTTAYITRKDRKSTRLNSSHMSISYAVFCLKKKNKK